MFRRTYFCQFLLLLLISGCGRTGSSPAVDTLHSEDVPGATDLTGSEPGVVVPPPFLYRFDEHLADAEIVQAAEPQAGNKLPVFDFENTDAVEGWSANAPGGEITLRDGILSITTKDQVVPLHSPDALGLDPFQARGLRFRMRASGTKTVLFKPRMRTTKEFNPTGGETVRVVEQGEWFNYRIEAVRFGGIGRTDAKHRTDQLLDQFRFEIPQNAKVEFDRFEFISLDELFAEAAVGTRSFEIDYQLRPVIYAHAPSHFAYELTVPQNGRLAFGVGIVHPDTSASFTIDIESANGHVEKLVDVAVGTNNDWTDQQTSLAKWAGESVRIHFRVATNAARAIGLWSNPMVYEPWQRKVQPQNPQDDLLARMRSRRPNVVVYTIDALRADRLDFHGYDRTLMPNLSALAAQGVNFTNAYTNDTWTKPSVATLFSGTPAEVHGISDIGHILPEGLPLMPEMFRRAAGPTLLLSENTHPGPATKMDRGFSYTNLVYLREGNPWHHTLPDFIQFIKRDVQLPFFVYTHRMIAHDPYQPRKDVLDLIVQDGDEVTDSDRYDAELIVADDQLGDFVARLKTLGLSENTLLIVTADHGEAFGEHKGIRYHAGKPYNEQIHVPLVLSMPGTLPAGRTIEAPVQWLDIPPTILDMYSLPVPDSYVGDSLWPLIADQNEQHFFDRIIVARQGGDYAAIRGHWKLFSHAGSAAAQLFDLQNDPGEMVDVAAQHPDIVESMSHALNEFRAEMIKRGEAVSAAESGHGAELSTDQIELLEALGYIE